jgi:sugar phosphate isomerase/epimerase
MMQEVDRKNVKLCLDVPLFYDRQREKYIREAVKQCGKNLVLSHFGAWNFKETNDGEVIQDASPSFGGQINYETFIEELQQIGYTGYLVSEYCLPVLKNHKVAGIEEVDQANRASLKYMKQLVKNPAAVQA